jgi:hypothetical protein
VHALSLSDGSIFELTFGVNLWRGTNPVVEIKTPGEIAATTMTDRQILMRRFANSKANCLACLAVEAAAIKAALAAK